MFVSRREHEELRKQVNELKELSGNLMQGIIEMQKEIAELKKPKEPDYFG